MNESELLSSKLSIVVVESDERILKRLAIWIQAITSETFMFDSPLEALEMLEKSTVDIVIFNSQMQEMGSMEFLEKIKQIDSNQVSVMMIEDIEKTLFKASIALGVDKYINTPVDAKVLLQVIEELAVEKVFRMEFTKQNKLLSEYKEAMDKSFVISKHTKDGKIEFINAAFSQLFCLGDEQEKEHYNPLFDDESKKIELIWNTLDNKEIFRGRQVYSTASGKNIIVDISVVPILNSDNEIDEYIAFLTDVTQMVEASQKLMDEKIHRLQAIKEHNEEMNKVKDSFLTVFTHELRTPLNAIINFSEHASKHVSKAEFSKKQTIVSELDAINESGIAILDMINNVMDAMKLRDKTILFTMRDFSVKQSLVSVIDRLEYLSDERKISLVLADDFTISSDDTRFSQIFLNIISNAFKYSKHTIKVLAKANENNFGVVVEDDGNGIVDNTKIFELFEQLSEDEMTRTASGIGVGLYIVKQLCDSFGYNIKIDKSPTLGGAKISITGPLKAKNGNN